jgi:hypothetical protein
MMTVIVDSVAAVREIRPDGVGQKLVLRFRGPFEVFFGVALVSAEHLLQKNDIGTERAQSIAQLVDHHAAVEERKTLVDVICDDVQTAIDGICSQKPGRGPARAQILRNQETASMRSSAIRASSASCAGTLI